MLLACCAKAWCTAAVSWCRRPDTIQLNKATAYTKLAMSIASRDLNSRTVCVDHA